MEEKPGRVVIRMARALEEELNADKLLLIGIDAINRVERLEPLAKRGKAFTEGPKGPRKDALRRLAETTIEALRKKLGRNPTGPEIIAGLDGLDEDGTIQEIKGEKIYWMTDRGQERITSFKAFFNRLPKIRK